MFADAVLNIMVPSIEVATGAGFLYFLYSVWCDARNTFRPHSH
jgi:hypothetical protein